MFVASMGLNMSQLHRGVMSGDVVMWTTSATNGHWKDIVQPRHLSCNCRIILQRAATWCSFADGCCECTWYSFIIIVMIISRRTRNPSSSLPYPNFLVSRHIRSDGRGRWTLSFQLWPLHAAPLQRREGRRG